MELKQHKKQNKKTTVSALCVYVRQNSQNDIKKKEIQCWERQSDRETKREIENWRKKERAITY